MLERPVLKPKGFLLCLVMGIVFLIAMFFDVTKADAKTLNEALYCARFNCHIKYVEYTMPRGKDRPTVKFEPLNTITATVTAYSEYDSCHTGASCLMASGKKAYVGAVACPRKYQLGTRVQISDTVYTCEDRTAAYVDGRFDIFTGYGQEGYNQAIQFGKQLKTITILL